jgi:hypothetical protein
MKQRVRLYRGISLFVAVSMTYAAGEIHGRLTARWGPPSFMVDATEQLQSVPTELGDWHMQDSSPISDAAIAQLQCAGYINRTYENCKTGQTVSMALLIGPAASVSIHTPEICFSSAQYSILGQRQRVNFGSKEAEGKFWALTLRSRDVDDNTLRVYYAWNNGNGWSAPERPRFSFTGRPFLYKMQLAAYVPTGEADSGEDPCHKFLESCLPEIEDLLITCN